MSYLALAIPVAEFSLVITAVLFVIFSSRWTLGESVLWILVILFIPLIGSIVFLVVDERKRKRLRVGRLGLD
jgi:hypothetical protein